jgi:hypothetical protein
VTLLEVLGAIALIALWLSLAGWIGVMIVPKRVHLEPAGEEIWRRPQLKAAYANSLIACGFVPAGTFRVREMPGVVVGLFVNPGASARAGITEHPAAGTSVEIISWFTDSTVLSASNRKGGWLPAIPWATQVPVRGGTVEQLWAAFMNARPAKEALPVSAEEAPRLFEKGYERIMSWRRRHSGLLTTLAVLRRPVVPETTAQAAEAAARETGGEPGQLSTAVDAEGGALSQATAGELTMSSEDRPEQR